MLKQVLAITLLAGATISPVFAQRRDFRAEKAQLAREEREQKRKEKEERFGPAPKIDYGTNILRLAPITAMDIGVGFGLSYEKIFGKEQMIGLVIPFSVILENDGYYDPNSWQNNNHYNAMFYFTPGVKIYPMGQRRVTYAVGPNLMIAYGRGNQWRYDGTNYRNVDIERFRFGMLVNNYVNFNITPAFNLGLELGLGVRYIDEFEVDGVSEYTNGIDVTGQFSMTLGYRF